MRVDRIAQGNFGDFKHVGGSVMEARVHFGPGYRLYFCQEGNKLIVMLAGGDKSSQSADIERAMQIQSDLDGTIMAIKTYRWDSSKYLETSEDIAGYIEAIFEDAAETNDYSLLPHALGVVARARGMTEIARETGLSRESLYKALSEEGNPSFATVMKVLQALSIELHAKASDKAKGGPEAA